MYAFDIKTKTDQTIICADQIPTKEFKKDISFICIPTSIINVINDITLIETIKDAKQYAEAIELHYHQFDDGYFKHAQKSNLPYLTKTINYAKKLRETDIPNQIGLDIDSIIKDCEEQIITIQKEEEKEQQRILANKQKELRKLEVGFIYLIKSDHGYKIGKSKNLSNRINKLGIQVPFEHECIYSSKFIGYHNVEKYFHKLFNSKRIKGEWFDLTEDDIIFIKEYSQGKVE
jgi:hypothetical protein